MIYKDFACLIPLRGGSKGIPRKNLLEINERPLYWFVAEAAIKAGIKTYISTEDEEIKLNCQENFSAIEVIDRPNELAEDHVSTEDVIEHFIETNTNHNHIILLQATSPMTKSSDITSAIEKYLKNSNKPLISVVNKHSFIWSKEGKAVNYDPLHRPRRQDWSGIFVENGAIYIFSREHFLAHKSRCLRVSTLFEMSNYTSIELDTMEDIKMISNLMKEE